MRRRTFLASAVAMATIGPRTAVAQVSIRERLAPGQPPLVIAHRAKVGSVPSNSLAGIRNAIEAGIEMVEVDVQVAGGGDHILMHDPVLGTTTNVREVFPNGSPSLEPGDPDASRHFIADYTLEDLARLQLRDREGGHHPIPTLDAALNLAQGQLLMILDLKIWDNESLLPLLARLPTENLLLFTTGSESRLLETAEATGIGVFLGLEDFTSAGRAFDRALERFGSQLRMVSVRPDQFSREIREAGNESDVRICVTGFALDDAFLLQSDSRPWARALASGADAYLTRLPLMVLELLQR